LLNRFKGGFRSNAQTPVVQQEMIFGGGMGNKSNNDPTQ
jgi:hypothetical protein